MSQNSFNPLDWANPRPSATSPGAISANPQSPATTASSSPSLGRDGEGLSPSLGSALQAAGEGLSPSLGRDGEGLSPSLGRALQADGEGLSDFEALVSAVESSRIDIAPSYQNWFRVATAIASTFGESGRSSFHRLSQFYPGYTAGECDDKFNDALRDPNPSVSIATVYYLALQAGVPLPSSSSCAERLVAPSPSSSSSLPNREGRGGSSSSLPGREGRGGASSRNRVNRLVAVRTWLAGHYHDGADFRFDVLSRKIQIRIDPSAPDASSAIVPLLPPYEGRAGEGLSPLASASSATVPLLPPYAGRAGEGLSPLWRDLSDRDICSFTCRIAADAGANIMPADVHTVLSSEFVPVIHPLRHWLASLPAWTPPAGYDPSSPSPGSALQAAGEGLSPIDALAAQVHVLPEATTLWRSCFRKWFVAMVAGWIFDDRPNHQVLVLISERQGIFKTTWLEHLIPPELRPYLTKLASARELGKDERLRTAEFGLINMDEIDSMTPREINVLKSVITTADVCERAAYGRTKERRIRCASFCASGNNRRFLSDDTGNRRWLPFEVLSIDSPFDHSEPYEDIYAEALYLIRSGFRYWFTSEETQALADHTDDFRAQAYEEQLLPLFFLPADKDTDGARFLAAAEIQQVLIDYGHITRPMPLNKFGALLQRSGFIRHSLKGGRKGYLVLQRQDRDVSSLHTADALAIQAALRTADSPASFPPSLEDSPASLSPSPGSAMPPASLSPSLEDSPASLSPSPGSAMPPASLSPSPGSAMPPASLSPSLEDSPASLSPSPESAMPPASLSPSLEDSPASLSPSPESAMPPAAADPADSRQLDSSVPF